MKKVAMVIRNLMFKEKKFVTSKELEELCIQFGLNYENTKKLLLNKGFLLTIFRGIFYAKDFNEKRTGMIKYTPYELLSKGMEIKGIKNWYFGLYTAFKLLNLTHEFFPMNYVINDRFNRIKPMKIHNENFKFVKIKNNLFFGIVEVKTKNNIILRYSDLEKTVLDMTYLYKKAGKLGSTINSLIMEYDSFIDKKKLLNYSEYYPKTIKRLIT